MEVGRNAFSAEGNLCPNAETLAHSTYDVSGRQYHLDGDLRIRRVIIAGTGEISVPSGGKRLAKLV